jgi:beta-mannosidase
LKQAVEGDGVGKINDNVRLYITSDERTAAIKGTLLAGILTFETCGLDVMEVPVNLPANTSRAFWESESIDKILTDPTSQCLVAMLSVRGNMVAKSAYFARPLKEMRFPLPKLLIQREQVDEEKQKITISADAYARNVAITNLPDSAQISDNYFDLLPGELRELEINNATLDQVKSAAINVWRK